MSNNQPMVCAHCRRVLDLAHTRDGHSYYVHNATFPVEGGEHDPVPVEAPEGYRGGRCDFCSANSPTHVVPARPIMGIVSDGSIADRSLDDDWAACAVCVPLLERNQWNRLLDRLAAQRADEGTPMGEEERTAVRQLWRVLRSNITGPVRPLPPLR